MNMSKGKRISVEEAELRILASLAEAPKSFYDLVQRENTASPNTVLKALEKLERYLQVVKGEPEARNRVPYRLTVYGLVRAFDADDVTFNVFKAAERYRDMFPLVFGKRGFFEGEGLFSDMLMRFIGATQNNMNLIKRIMEEVDKDWKKEAEENISEYPITAGIFKKVHRGEELKERLDKLNEVIERQKKILDTDDETLETQKIETLKNFTPFLVDEITKETLFSFRWSEEFIRPTSESGDIYSALKTYFKARSPYFKIYVKDKELREFLTGYLEDQVKREQAHLKAVMELKEEWDALNNEALDS